MSTEWKTPFCGCFSAIGPCLFAFCCPGLGANILQCQTKNTLDETGGCVAYLCACCLGCYGSAFNRYKVREHFSIKGSYLLDCLIYTFCLGLCAVVQEYREAKEQKKGGK